MLRLSSSSRSLLAAFALLAACSDGVAAQVQPRQPGSAAAVPDPVSAAIAEASRRFGVPEHWIRAVMRVESAGRVDAVSHAGAMGLMQVMPGTYAELRARYGLGADPFAVRDNVMAGTAYLREMFDRYGTTGMLAAYNAGPGRWEAHLAGVRPLPAETVGYLARLGPVLNIGDVPSVSVARAPTAASPFSAPIFVAWSAGAVTPERTSDARSLRQVDAANTTVVPPTGRLFVARQPVVALAPEPNSVSPIEARPTSNDVTNDDTSEPQSDHGNGLFVPRTREPSGG
ncbi:lytic transglycosylase domain-containing protein [Bosea eneae]|uniref:Lytic transglycosylase domain-containing protein n=1 Tax=Bosea eneae TaxID=151454 RepID=A0ABW0J002_9HYPH